MCKQRFTHLKRQEFTPEQIERYLLSTAGKTPLSRAPSSSEVPNEVRRQLDFPEQEEESKLELVEESSGFPEEASNVEVISSRNQSSESSMTLQELIAQRNEFQRRGQNGLRDYLLRLDEVYDELEIRNIENRSQ